MLLRRFTDFVLQSRVQAMAAAFVVAFIPIIGSISVIIAALVTLRKGVVEGALVFLAATLPYVISYFVWIPEPGQAQMDVIMLAVVLISNLLTWIFAVVLARFSNWNFTLELAALLGVLAVGIVHLINPDIQDWWAQHLTAYFNNMVSTVNKIETSTVVSTDVTRQEVVAAKLFATGFVTTLMLFNALLQLAVARWWQAAVFNPGGLRKELHQIRLGNIAGGIFIAALLLALFGNDFALDEIPVMYAMFFLAGLSLLHCLANTTKQSWAWLSLIYVGITWLFPLSLLVVSIIALLDTGIDFRKRFNLKR